MTRQEIPDILYLKWKSDQWKFDPKTKRIDLQTASLEELCKALIDCNLCIAEEYPETEAGTYWALDQAALIKVALNKRFPEQADAIIFEAQNIVSFNPAPDPPRGWQLIETAPIETVVDLWCVHVDPDCKDRRVANVVNYNSEWVRCTEQGIRLSKLEKVLTPTHWMPIPEKPA